MGKVTIEKLLRSTEVKQIIVMMRPKRGQTIQERIADWKTSPLFEVLLKSNPSALDRVLVIAGDCELPDLGISDQDRAMLVQKVQVVLHIAANVKFNEPLHIALDTNTRGTRLILQLAKQMVHLEALVHVSTAYSNCVSRHISERYYPELLSCSANQILTLREQLGEELLDTLAPTLVGKFPNTYTFTKALAEQVVETEASDLPVCIFRPGIITNSYEGPLPGWIDNYYGPLSVSLGVMLGFLRVLLSDPKVSTHIVPVDYCANTALACAWHTAGQSSAVVEKDQPNIYNYVPTKHNLTTWGHMKKACMECIEENPSNQMIWLPFLHFTQNIHIFNIAIIFYHLLPGYVLDLGLRLRGKKPRMIKLYEKAHRNFLPLSLFSLNEWHFETNNVERLWLHMSTQDQELFGFDMTQLDWKKYYQAAGIGVRTFLLKEDLTEKTKVRAKKLYKRFQILHRLLQFGLWSGFAAIFWAIIKG